MRNLSVVRSLPRHNGLILPLVGALTAAMAGLLGGCLGDSDDTPVLSVETRSTVVPTQGAPFVARLTSSGAVLVSVSRSGTPPTGKTGIEVFEKSSAGLASKCLNDTLSNATTNVAKVMGLALFSDGSALAAAIEDAGLALLHPDNIAACSKPLLRHYVDQGTDLDVTPSSASGTFDVVVTRDGQFAFAANEYGIVPGPIPEPPSDCPGPEHVRYKGNVGVTTIVRNAAGNFAEGTGLKWRFSTGGCAIAGILLSNDGKRLYVTTEIAGAGTQAAGAANPLLGGTRCLQDGSTPQRNGLLTVIDVDAAKKGPGAGVILATIAAGCSPVRMAQTADGKVLWVTARGDNRVLAFSTAKLESDPGNALIGHADTGGLSPVGLALFHGDRLLAVANSDRFTLNNPHPNATILDVSNPESPQLVHTLATGKFPRNITVGPDDATLYLTNFDSFTLQVIETKVQ